MMGGPRMPAAEQTQGCHSKAGRSCPDQGSRSTCWGGGEIVCGLVHGTRDRWFRSDLCMGQYTKN